MYSSIVYPSVPLHGYNYYHPHSFQSLTPHDRYYNALAEARAARADLLVAEAIRREEERLQLELDMLRQFRLASQYNYHNPHPHHLPYTLSSPSPAYNDSLESLRFQIEEEERLARQDFLRQRQGENSTIAAARRQAELQEERELLDLERLRRRRGFQLAQEKGKLRESLARALTPTPPTKSAAARSCTNPPRNLIELAFQPASEGCGTLRGTPSQQIQKPQPSKTQISAQNPISHIVDLNGLLQQLLLSASKNEAQEEKLAGRPNASEARPNIVPGSSILESPKTQPSPPATTVPAFGLAQFLNGLMGPSEPERVKDNMPSSSSSQVSQPEPTGATLKEQLENRLNNESANEVRDTIQALLASLSDYNPTTHEAHEPQATGATSSYVFKSSGKGKSKEGNITDTEGQMPSKGIDEAMGLILTIEDRFHTLEDEFVLPEKLDFALHTLSAAGAASATSRLTYTASNHPIRFYEQSLSRLLTQLDSIESRGSEELRKKRKEVVDKVEHALEDLERRIQARWNSEVGKESNRSTRGTRSTEESPAAPLTLELTEDNEARSEPSSSAPAPSQPKEDVTQSQEILVEEPLRVESSSVNPNEGIAAPAQDGSLSVVEGSANDEPVITPTKTKADKLSARSPQEFLHVGITQTGEVQRQAPQPECANEQVFEEAPADNENPTQVLQHSTASAYPPEPRGLPSAYQTDLSATVRLSTPVTPQSPMNVAADLPSSDVGQETESDSEGFLLGNGMEEGGTTSKHQDIDADSTASDWSEVDAPAQ